MMRVYALKGRKQHIAVGTLGLLLCPGDHRCPDLPSALDLLRGRLDRRSGPAVVRQSAL